MADSSTAGRIVDPTTADGVFEALRDSIHAGRLVPGQRLIEADLVEQFRTNRSRLREAFRRLQADGLVTIDRNRGASVRRISRQEMIDTMAVIEALSFLMVDKSIDRREEPEVAARLEASLAQSRAFRATLNATSQPRRFMDENARFWDTFDSIADNPVLSETRRRLETALFRLVLDNMMTRDKERWVARHEDIMVAVMAGDRRRARIAVGHAVAKVLDAILALPDDAFAW